MTDYLEELLDQLEEEEADVAAHWPEDLAPTWAEFPGGAEPRGETRTTGRSPVTVLPEAVWTEAWEALESPEAVESALLPGPPETWTVARGPVPPEKEPTDAHIPEFLEAAAWPAPQPDALEEADGRKSERPALLERAERLDRAVRQARRGDTAVRSTGSPAGGTALSGLAARQSGGWLERGEDHAAAVDRAFQRDSRRYDQGFALY